MTMATPTRGMVDVAGYGGWYTWPVTGQAYQRVQTASVANLLHGTGPRLRRPEAVHPGATVPPAYRNGARCE